MDLRVMKSVGMLALVAVLGVGATYAAFTSNAVTISNNQMTTGLAELKICNSTSASGWTTGITPNLSLSGLVPGDTDQDLTGATNIYVGNDSGTLNDNGIVGCASYPATAGSSDVDMNLVPKITELTCDDTGALLDDQFSLKFQFDGGNDTVYKTLTEWTTNTATFGPLIVPDEEVKITMLGQLNEAASEQGKNCTFTVEFTGMQPEEVE